MKLGKKGIIGLTIGGIAALVAAGIAVASGKKEDNYAALPADREYDDTELYDENIESEEE